MQNTPYVKQIDLSLATLLKEALLAQGFELSIPPYTLFSGKKKGVTCTLYLSGKLVVQGSLKDDFIRFFIEPEIVKEIAYDYQTILESQTNESFQERIGIDESGKGDFFGPLCIAGVCANREEIIRLKEIGVKDSKLLSDAQILMMAEKIKLRCRYHIVKINPLKYNELYNSFKNLNTLLGWGHATTIETLVLETKCQDVIIDQFASEYVVKNALKRKSLKVNLTQRHRGEEDLVVAAASILARATFLEGLKELGKKAGHLLPKGANSKVTSIGKKIKQEQGVDALKLYGKLHFKTLDVILKEF